MMMFQYYNEKESTYLILYMSSRLRLAYTTLLKLFPYFRFPSRNIFLIFFKGTVSGFFLTKMTMYDSPAAVVHLNFRAGSTFSFPVCTVPCSMDRSSRWNKVDAVRLYASYGLNLLLLKGKICVDSQWLS